MANNINEFSTQNKVSPSVIRRLPVYYRILKDRLLMGEVKISSSQLAKLSGATASQIRQDLNYFGGFGQQGFGYNIQTLLDGITNIIGIPNCHKAVLIGAGNIGRALTMHLDFSDSGFSLMGVFDVDESVIGTSINGIKVRHINEAVSFCKINNVHTAIICVPRESAKNVVDDLYGANVYNFWNFSYYDIKMDYPDTNVENVHLGDSLMNLCYHATND